MSFYDKICAFFSEPYKVLTFTFCIGTTLAFISIFCSGFIYGDAVLYTTMAHYFGMGDYSRGFLDGIPPLFPAISGLLCKIGIPAQYSTHIVSCACCILTIFPLYFLLCFFMEKKYAAWGCMFYLFAPKILRFGMASQIEGARFFFLILPIYFVFSFAKNRKIITLIWMGISFALLALVRGEGIVFVPVMLLALILLLLKRNNYNISLNFLIRVFGYCLLSIMVMMVVVTPRMYQVYMHTGYPALDKREANSIREFSQNIKDFFYTDKTIQKASSGQVQTAGGTLPAQSKTVYSDPNTYNYFTIGRLRGFLDRFSVGTFELYEILFVLGVVFLLRRKEWSLEHNIMLMLVICNALIFYFVVLTYRYFLINILLLTPFTVSGYRFILELVNKYRKARILFPIIVFFAALGQVGNGMADSLESKRKEPKYFGLWLKENKAVLVNPKKNNNERMHILVFGNRPDYPFFANADFSIYKKQKENFGLELPMINNMDIKEAVKGFPSKYCYYTDRLLPSDEIIMPDILVIESPKDYQEEIELLRLQPALQEVKIPYKDYLLFKNIN